MFPHLGLEKINSVVVEKKGEFEAIMEALLVLSSTSPPPQETPQAASERFSEKERQEVVAQLLELFPGVAFSAIEEALRKSGDDIEAAINALLVLDDGNEEETGDGTEDEGGCPSLMEVCLEALRRDWRGMTPEMLQLDSTIQERIMDYMWSHGAFEGKLLSCFFFFFPLTLFAIDTRTEREEAEFADLTATFDSFLSDDFDDLWSEDDKAIDFNAMDEEAQLSLDAEMARMLARMEAKTNRELSAIEESDRRLAKALQEAEEKAFAGSSLLDEEEKLMITQRRKEKEEELSKRLIESLLFEDEQDRIQLAEERKRAQEKPPEPQIQPAPVRSTTTPTEKLAGWERVADERKEAERQELERLQRVRIMEDSLLNSDQLVQREINSLMQRIEEAEIKYSFEASDEGLATTFLGLEGLGELKQVLRRYAYVRLKRVIKPELRERFERQWLSYKRQYGGGSNLAAPTYTLIISKLFSLLYL